MGRRSFWVVILKLWYCLIPRSVQRLFVGLKTEKFKSKVGFYSFLKIDQIHLPVEKQRWAEDGDGKNGECGPEGHQRRNHDVTGRHYEKAQNGSCPQIGAGGQSQEPEKGQ